MIWLLFVVAGMSPAHGSEPSPVGMVPAATYEQYLSDLRGEDSSERLFAARELRRRVRHASRRANRGGSPLRVDGAIMELQTYDQTLAPACIDRLLVTNVTLLCADILGLLGTQEAQSALQRAMESSPKRRIRRHLERALALLGTTP